MCAAEQSKAYLDGYQHDVFISYARGYHSQQDVDRWMDDFWKTLAGAIENYLGCRGKLSVFLDKRSLARNELVDETLRLACQQSAVLVCVVSANYLNSDYCRREREAFCERLQSRPMSGTSVPIFRVMLQDLDVKTLPEPLYNLNAYTYPRFFLHDPSHPDVDFRMRTYELGEEIAKTLQGIGKTEQRTPAVLPRPPLPGPADDRTVYVAEGADDVRHFRANMVGELKQLRVQVLPGDLLLHEYHASESQVKEALERSLFSVHLLGRYYGSPVLNDPQKRSLPHLQYELAAQARKPRIVWMADDIDESTLPEEEQKSFVDAVKHEEGSKTGLEWVRGNLQALKDLIRSRLPPPPPPPTASARRNLVDKLPRVYITAQEKDINRSEVQQIITYCVGQGFKAVATNLSEAPDKREQQDVANIRFADGLLILYGHSDPGWVRARAERAENSKRTKNPLVPAILNVPPPPERKLPLNFGSPKVMDIDARNGFSPEMLGEFLNRIREGRSR